MNQNKICIILCGNDEQMEANCVRWIQGLHVPEGYELENLIVHDAVSMAAGYNEAMAASDAKYKIYIHQDVYLIYKDLLAELLHIFEDRCVGMLGLVGSPRLPENGVMWDGERVGKWYESNFAATEEYGKAFEQKPYAEVQAVDGFFIATQYDLPWREDLFGGWDFYDVSQGMEFRRAGYKVVVPNLSHAWALHNAEGMNLKDYFHWQKIFLKEYEKDLQRFGDKCQTGKG